MLSDTMAGTSAEVVICGAGIAGVAAAYHLAVRRGVRGVVVVDRDQLGGPGPATTRSLS